MKILRCFIDFVSDEINYSVVLSRGIMKAENKLLAINRMSYCSIKPFHATDFFL